MDWKHYREVTARANAIVARISKVRGPHSRAAKRAKEMARRIASESFSAIAGAPQSAQAWRELQSLRRERCKASAALSLARRAGVAWDEHGRSRGDYKRTSGIDYIPPHESKAAPFLDSGGAGLALIETVRERYYSKSYNRSFGPGVARSRFLIGRNEAGTWFAHPVPQTICTVRDAVAWIWRGMEEKIIVRQGDIALVSGRGKSDALPSGHVVCDGYITHATHPTIPAPNKGQRIIVGRRAVAYATAPSRD